MVFPFLCCYGQRTLWPLDRALGLNRKMSVFYYSRISVWATTQLLHTSVWFPLALDADTHLSTILLIGVMIHSLLRLLLREQ